MKGWRSGASPRHGAPPVEMRFIDMFMAALGAALFMALLLAFLVRYLPNGPGATDHPDPAVQPLELLTHKLAAAQVGDAYELALAYRGGAGAVHWSIDSGAEALPRGLGFEAAKGLLAGTPTSAGTFRIVVTVRDAAGGADERGLELKVLEPPPSARRLSAWVAVLVLALLFYLCYMFWNNVRAYRYLATAAGEARRAGQSTFQYGQGDHRTVSVNLDRGVEELQAHGHQARFRFQAGVALGVAVAAYLVWAIL